MNRATFFKRLFVGAAAAPAIARVIAEPKSPFAFRKVGEFQSATRKQPGTGQYRGLQFGVDRDPLRFKMEEWAKSVVRSRLA